MRRFVLTASTLAAALAAGAGTPAGAAPRRALLPSYRLRTLDDSKSRASIPVTLEVGGPPCNAAFPDVPVVLGPGFDPDDVEEIETTPNGRIVVWTTLIGETPIPGTTRDIVLFREGVAERVRVSDAAGDNDQPSIGVDPFGYRLAWRGSAGARGATAGNIYLRTARRVAPEPSGEAGEDPEPTEEVETEQITNLTSTATAGNFGTAYDPALCARTRSIDFGSGVRVRVRDARIAFVSTGDLVTGSNEDHLPQLFVWREHASEENEFVQITHIEGGGLAVNRPSINVAGDRIAFESTADLAPNAADPKDPSRVGNPEGFRQIYLWEERTGRVRQLTWGEADSFAPRISLDGRFVLFCSKADLIPGGNPEGNFEVFAWVDGRDESRALRQMTQTAAGQSVLPRPTRTPGVFAFWSTASPPTASAGFGEGNAQCGPLPYVFRRGAVVQVGGRTDAENLLDRFSESVDDPPERELENPIFAGPPCVGATGSKVEFVTNDNRLNEPKADDDLDGDDGAVIDDNGTPDDPSDDVHEIDDRKLDASLIIFHVARATRHRPRTR